MGNAVRQIIRELHGRIGPEPEPLKCGRVSDPAFVYRGNPAQGEHDQLGYRNRAILDRPDVLIIGDSQVYCPGVSCDQSWPAVFADLSGCDAYMSAVCGWGVLQYMLAFEELLPLSPRQVFVFVYPGNDIFETLRDCRLSSSASARALMEDVGGLPPIDLRSFSKRNEEVARLISIGFTRAQALASCSAQGMTDVCRATLEGRTYFLKEGMRFTVSDLEHPAIQGAFVLVERCLKRMAKLANSARIKLTVFGMPTLEYLMFLQGGGAKVQYPEKLGRLGRNEKSVFKRLRSVCARNGIVYRDVGPVLSNQLVRGIYPSDSDDGHLNALGCELVGKLVNSDASFERMSEAVIGRKGRRPRTPSDSVGRIYPLW